MPQNPSADCKAWLVRWSSAAKSLSVEGSSSINCPRWLLRWSSSKSMSICYYRSSLLTPRASTFLSLTTINSIGIDSSSCCGCCCFSSPFNYFMSTNIISVSSVPSYHRLVDTYLVSNVLGCVAFFGLKTKKDIIFLCCCYVASQDINICHTCFWRMVSSFLLLLFFFRRAAIVPLNFQG